MDAIKQAALMALDTLDGLLGRTDELTPPRRLMSDGPRDPVAFRQNGEEFLTYYRELCGLQPHHRVLDVGCGIGRKTVPLLRYLDERASFYGFDVVSEGIEWCQQQLTARRPNFHFERVDIFNARYNPRGSERPDSFRFPCDDRSFDLVSVASVFTHMLADDVAHYLKEIHRVLAPDGCCLCSFFLLNQESLEHLQRGEAALRFAHPVPGGLTTDRSVPEEAVAFQESFVQTLFQRAGLAIRAPIRYGSWCGRKGFLSFQDLVVAASSDANGQRLARETPS